MTSKDISGSLMGMNFGSGTSGGLRLHTPQHVYTDNSRLIYSGLDRYQQNGVFSDVAVLTPSGKRIKCHQLVLASCSKKFAGALEGGDFAGQELPVQGVDAEALELVIRFFYTAECPITVSTAIPILDAAIKLDVPGLTSACEQFINQLLHPLTVVTFIEQSLNLKLDIVTEVLINYIANRFDEVTQSHTFPNCEYSTFLKIVLDNKHRQSEAALFKAASRWILADNSRVDLAEEIFRCLGISQAAVQAHVQQSTLQLLHPNSHHGSLMNRGGEAGPSAGLSILGGGAPGLQQPGSLMNAVQLLPNGSTMKLPASLALQLQQGMPASGMQDVGPVMHSPSGLLALMKPHPQLSNISTGMMGLQGQQQPQQLLQQQQQQQNRWQQEVVKADGANAMGLSGLGAADAGLGVRKASALGQENGGRLVSDTGQQKLHGQDGGRALLTRQSTEDGKHLVPKRPKRPPEDRPQAEQRQSPEDAIASAKQALASGAQSLADFGLDPEQIEQMPTIGNQPTPIKGVCHVDGCSADLTQLRDYHQRFKICDFHLKVNSIMKDGLPQRFCQQCGRFHLLTEFDGNKRSCRARLQRHNARRRKRLDEALEMEETHHHQSNQETESGTLPEGYAAAVVANALAQASNAAAGGGVNSQIRVQGSESYMAAMDSGMGAAARGGMDSSFVPSVVGWQHNGQQGDNESATAAAAATFAAAAAAAAAAAGGSMGRNSPLQLFSVPGGIGPQGAGTMSLQELPHSVLGSVDGRGGLVVLASPGDVFSQGQQQPVVRVSDLGANGEGMGGVVLRAFEQGESPSGVVLAIQQGQVVTGDQEVANTKADGEPQYSRALAAVSADDEGAEHGDEQNQGATWVDGKEGQEVADHEQQEAAWKDGRAGGVVEEEEQEEQEHGWGGG